MRKKILCWKKKWSYHLSFSFIYYFLISHSSAALRKKRVHSERGSAKIPSNFPSFARPSVRRLWRPLSKMQSKLEVKDDDDDVNEGKGGKIDFNFSRGRPYLTSEHKRTSNLRTNSTELAKTFVLGCVISPLRQQAESRNLGQTFLANSV